MVIHVGDVQIATTIELHPVHTGKPCYRGRPVSKGRVVPRKPCHGAAVGHTIDDGQGADVDDALQRVKGKRGGLIPRLRDGAHRHVGVQGAHAVGIVVRQEHDAGGGVVPHVVDVAQDGIRAGTVCPRGTHAFAAGNRGHDAGRRDLPDEVGASIINIQVAVDAIHNGVWARELGSEWVRAVDITSKATLPRKRGDDGGGDVDAAHKLIEVIRNCHDAPLQWTGCRQVKLRVCTGAGSVAGGAGAEPPCHVVGAWDGHAQHGRHHKGRICGTIPGVLRHNAAPAAARHLIRAPASHIARGLAPTRQAPRWRQVGGVRARQHARRPAARRQPPHR